MPQQGPEGANGPGIFDQGLAPVAANHQPLSPVGFLDWAAVTYARKTAVIYRDQRFTYREMAERCRRLAGALAGAGVGRGDTVAMLAPNVPALLEGHYGVPMAGAVLNAINTRLDAKTIAFILDHGEAKVFIAHESLLETARQALAQAQNRPKFILIADPATTDTGAGTAGEDAEYETFLKTGSDGFTPLSAEDEWDAISLNYTSGTTGNPKGVVCHHRGAFLNALGNAMIFGLDTRSVYLWTLPMFHCNGWCFPWTVTALGGTHVCLDRPDPELIFPAIAEHGVTHMCGAPIVLNMLIHAPDGVKRRFPHTVDVATGGASPPSTVIAAMEELGFRVTHVYGLTEVYGPSTYCAWQADWDDMDLDARAAMMARQGVRYPTLSDQAVLDPVTLEPVPADGKTMGELMLKGHTVMKGYLKNPEATEAAFAGGWFHSGDLAVQHPDGYVEIKDRSKDVIISGGENISSLEVEEALYRHPRVMEAAVVARPDEKWGETPCAFITLSPGRDGGCTEKPGDRSSISADDIIQWCRSELAHFKVPKSVVFGPLPKTATGKIQKNVLRERARELRDGG